MKIGTVIAATCLSLGLGVSCADSHPEASTANAEVVPGATVASTDPTASDPGSDPTLSENDFEPGASTGSESATFRQPAVAQDRKLADATTTAQKPSSPKSLPSAAAKTSDARRETSAPQSTKPTETAPETAPVTAPETADKAPAAALSHRAFDELLSKYVSSTGAVDYAGLKTQRGKLDAYLKTLSDNTPTEAWSRDERLAYWINAYNAGTIRLILDNYPLKSIQDLDGGKTWDVKRVKLGDKTYSLNQIENDIIRPRFKEPRIHFAVNCAAKGCPPLRNEAFTADKLERQLAEQTRKFLNDSRYTKVDGDNLSVSKIFDWYGSDFADVKSFVGKYRDVPEGATVEYVDYDWSLNKA